MKLFLILLLCLFPLTVFGQVSNGDIDDEDMADISDWSDLDAGDSVSSQVTFDSKSCMKLDSGPSTGWPNYAFRRQDIGSFATRTIFSFSAYCDALGTRSDEDQFRLRVNDGTIEVRIDFASDGLYVWDGASYIQIDADIVVQDTWQEWTFDIDWVAKTLDVYLGKVLRYSDVDCSYDREDVDGQTHFYQFGTVTTHRLTYVDWFKAGTDFAVEEVGQFIKIIGN